MNQLSIIRIKYLFMALAFFLMLSAQSITSQAAAAPIKPELKFNSCTSSQTNIYDCSYDLILNSVGSAYNGPFGVAFWFADAAILDFSSSNAMLAPNATDGYCESAEFESTSDPDNDFAVFGMQQTTNVGTIFCGDYYAPKSINVSSSNPLAIQLTFKLDGTSWGGAGVPARACAAVYGVQNSMLAPDIYCAHNTPPTKKCIASPSNKEVFRAAMDANYGDTLGIMPVETLTQSWNNQPPRQVNPINGHGGKAARLTKAAQLRYKPVKQNQSPFKFGSSPFSIDAWVKFKDANLPIIDTREKGTGGGVFISVKNQVIVAEVFDTNGVLIATTTTDQNVMLNDNKWRHIAVTYKTSAPSRLRIYLDGVLQKPEAPMVPTAVGGGQQMIVGHNAMTNDKGAALQIDDLTIHHRVLFVSEVVQLAKFPRCK